MKFIRINFFILIMGLIALAACKQKDQNLIERCDWIIGTWANQNSKAITYETWTQINEQELMAKSYALNNQDTILFETIQFIQQGKDIYYIPTVVNQNEGLPIRFALSQLTDSSWIVENPGHDFPQKITYHQIAKDSLLASISGVQDGAERAVNFSMKRIK